MLLGGAAVLLAAVGLTALVRFVGEKPGSAARQLRPGIGGLAKDPLVLAFLLFLVSAAVSTVTSISPRTSWQGGERTHAGLGTVLAFTTLFCASRALCRTASEARELLASAVLGSGAAAVYALLQTSHLDPIGWTASATYQGAVRPFGSLGHPNFLAAFLVMTLPLTAYFVLQATKQRYWGALVVLGLVGVTSLLAVVLSLSRGAWLGLVCAALVPLAYWLFHGRRRRQIAVVSLLLLSGVGLALALVAWGNSGRLDGLVTRVRQVRNLGAYPYIWKAGVCIFRNHPIVGRGLDTFRLAFSRERTPGYWQVEWGATPYQAHSEFIQVLASQGLLGAVALLAMLVGLVMVGRRAWQRVGPEDRPLLVALLAGLVGLIVQSAFTCTAIACGALFVTVAGVLSGLGNAQQSSRVCRGLRQPRLAFCLGIAASALVILFTFNFAGTTSAGGPGPLPAVAILALAIALTAWALVRVVKEAKVDGPPVEAEKKGAPRLLPGWARLLQPIIWAGAATVIAVALARPFWANVLCYGGEQALATEPARALELLHQAVALDPGRAAYWERLGYGAKSAADQGQPDRQQLLRQACAALEEASRLVPVDAGIHDNLGRVRAQLVRAGLAAATEVFADFDTALELDPTNALYYVDAADAALALGNSEQAGVYARRAEALYPQFGPPLAQLGYLALAGRRPLEAVHLLDAAVAAQWPDADAACAVAWGNLAAASLQLSRWEEVVQAGREALRRAPQFTEMHNLIAQALHHLHPSPAVHQ
jgi:O-antigen ligase